MKIAFFLLITKYFSLSENDIINESQLCGEHKFNKDNCVESYNCIYMNWYIEEFDAEIPFCFSY